MIKGGGSLGLQERIGGSWRLRLLSNMTMKREGIRDVHKNELRRLTVGIGGHHWASHHWVEALLNVENIGFKTDPQNLIFPISIYYRYKHNCANFQAPYCKPDRNKYIKKPKKLT